MSGAPSALESVQEVGTLALGERAVLRGRVTAADRTHLRLEDHRGSAVLGAARVESPAIGSWIECVVVREPDGLVLGGITQVWPPLSTFPRPGGEWLAFHRDGRSRLRALEARARALASLRSWFAGQCFLEVETPLAVPSPGLDVHLAAFGVTGMRGDGGPVERWLITSPEYQMKRLLAAGLPRIFQLARCFRRDERGARHEPEFTMLEWYRAFAGSEAVMRDTEEMVAALAQTLHGSTVLEVSALGCPPSRIDFAPPWDRITVDDALRLHAGVSLAEVLPDEERFFLTWGQEVEPRLGRSRPAFVIDWPASMASLARLHPDRPHLADRFEAYVAGIELANGFGELVDATEQRTRLVRDQASRRSAGREVYPIDERFLGALEEGLPPSAGNALGLDRLLAILTGSDELDAVLAFGAARL